MQTILLHSENEGIDAPVALAVHSDMFIVGMPWLTYGTYLGHAYVYEKTLSSKTGAYQFTRVADLVAPSDDAASGVDNAYGATVAISADYSFVGTLHI